MYLDRDGNVVKGASTEGHLAVGRAGHGGRAWSWRSPKYGTMKRAALHRPGDQATRSDGFVLEQGDVDMLATATDGFPEGPGHRPRSSWTTGEPFKAGQKLVQKDLARTLQLHRATRAPTVSTRARSATRSSRRARRGKGIITQADLDAVQDARAQAGRVQLPRLRHRLGAAAELGRRDRLRDAEHPRRLSAAGAGLSLGAGGAVPDRGDAPRVCRSQQLPRRPGLRETIRSTTCSTRITPRRSARRSTRTRPAFRSESSPASRRTKAATPRTIRSSTSGATRCRSPTR